MKAKAHAKINLGLVVGPLRNDGKHEILTVLQRVELHDDIELEPASETAVEGFDEDTIVAEALATLARAANVRTGWLARITKRIPVAGGLGGGSGDAAAALELANASLPEPLSPDVLHDLAATLGADVPFFLRDGAQLASGDGTTLRPIALPLDYQVVLVVPSGAAKRSTGAVYGDFDRRDGAEGFEERARSFTRALEAIGGAHDLAGISSNDLVSSPVADELLGLGAFRADVSGAGPTVYGLFASAQDAERAARALDGVGRTIVTSPL